MKIDVEKASVLITGANGGIGFEVVKQLIKKKTHRIILACRTQEKANAVKDKLPKSNTIIEAYGGFDMNYPESIKNVVEIIPKEKKIDIVFLQSGGMVVSNQYQFISKGGKPIEKTMFQNVFGAYCTLMFLEQNNLITSNARIVFAGGEGARGIKGMIEKPTFDSVSALRSYIFNGDDMYSDINALGISKFMSALLVQKLAAIDREKTYVWFSPGLTAGTNGLRNVSQPKRFIMEKIGFPIMKLFGLAQSPEKAAGKFTDCLVGIYGKSGDVLGAPEGKTLGKLVDQKPMNNGLTNLQFINAFWDIIEETCGKLHEELQE